MTTVKQVRRNYVIAGQRLAYAGREAHIIYLAVKKFPQKTKDRKRYVKQQSPRVANKWSDVRKAASYFISCVDATAAPLPSDIQKTIVYKLNQVLSELKKLNVCFKNASSRPWGLLASGVHPDEVSEVINQLELAAAKLVIQGKEEGTNQTILPDNSYTASPLPVCQPGRKPVQDPALAEDSPLSMAILEFFGQPVFSFTLASLCLFWGILEVIAGSSADSQDNVAMPLYGVSMFVMTGIVAIYLRRSRSKQFHDSNAAPFYQGRHD